MTLPPPNHLTIHTIIFKLSFFGHQIELSLDVLTIFFNCTLITQKHYIEQNPLRHMLSSGLFVGVVGGAHHGAAGDVLKT